MAKITIELTDEQAAIIKDEIQGYAVTLADDRLAQKKEQERAQLIRVLSAKDDKELAEAAAPIIAAEKIKAEAKEAEIKG